MDRPDTEPPLESMLQALVETIGTRQKVFLGELTDSLGTRGFGPVILLASAMTMLPTGIIPGVPAFMGLIMILAGGQMLTGHRELWLPPRIYAIQLPGPALLRGIARAEPIAIKLERYIKARWQFLVTWQVFLWLIALVMIFSALLIITIGAIPGLPFLLAMHILAFGLGLTTSDGRFILAGFVIFLPSAWLAAWLSGLL
ncbi:exopolysaccharide biosynthesis protein [Tropicimonas sp. TH_r6]|uniref:exopolysaccharide biosynthesis protein n=1 Tax=Tropicimonas sp. TH_r6 TaxID=3082085 RepID=UPI0029551A4D|nr:exopolysaccharide biosynthesis protein [Tropicimonas sp. TH_r6]MDV7144803.1 exopolysaccharide biosynthesis protein [Tropicimonas sp. TH_r6]